MRKSDRGRGDDSRPVTFHWLPATLSQRARHRLVAAASRRVGRVDPRQPGAASRVAEVPLVIAGERLPTEAGRPTSSDPSRPGEVVARYRQATPTTSIGRVACAVTDPARLARPLLRASGARSCSAWRTSLAARRSALMGAMLAEGGKLLTEVGPRGHRGDRLLPLLRPDCRGRSTTCRASTARGRGVVVVVSPWNFPLAIPCGGVAAALAAGNTVILKPASDTVLIAYRMCECFWDAGVPREALQFAPCSGASAGQHLVTHPGVDAVILTGGTETAQRMLAAKPAMNLSPRPAARTPRSSPRWPTATWRSRTCCTRPSATAGRSAPRRRC